MSLICRRFSRRESRREALPARGGPTAAGTNALTSQVIRHFVVFAVDVTNKPLAVEGSDLYDSRVIEKRPRCLRAVARPAVLPQLEHVGDPREDRARHRRGGRGRGDDSDLKLSPCFPPPFHPVL